MLAIQAPISADESGVRVANLQDALLAFLERPEHQIIRPRDMPYHPTPEELQALTDDLREERRRSRFGAATLQLVIHFQEQQRLSGDLHGVVERTTAARLNDWLTKLRLLDVRETFDPGHTVSLEDLLTTLPKRLTADQQRALAVVSRDLRADDPQLSERIAAIPGFTRKQDAVGVARTLRLGTLTEGNVPLTHALQRRPELANDPQGSIRGLTALSHDKWFDLAVTHGMPTGSVMTPGAYARTLALDVERQHPTEALAAHVGKGRRLGKQPVLAGVGEFLRANPSFDIGTANLNVLAEPRDGSDPVPKPVVAGLRALQHFKAIDASWDEAATLLEHELHAPDQLLAAGPGQLTTLLEGQLAPERVAALYRQVEDLHSTTVGVMTAALSPLSGPRILPGQYGRDVDPNDLRAGDRVGHASDDNSGGVAGLKALADVVAARGSQFDPRNALTLRGIPSKNGTNANGSPLNLGGVIDQQPTLRALFGDQDACACGHCHSVLSPAAYFIDVLQFIKDAYPDGRVLGRLLERRPDLQDIELSCNNTNTVVPSIDLALEILENAVALPLDVELQAGTDIEAELNGLRAAGEVRKALEKTTRSLSDDLSASQGGATPGGTMDWTIVDGHRRWTLTHQRRGLLVEANGRQPRLLDGLDVSAVIAALNAGQIGGSAAAEFEQLFAPNDLEPPDLANYLTTIAPLPAEKAWRVRYRAVAELLIDADALELTLQTPDGAVWWHAELDQRTITYILNMELSNDLVPEVVKTELAAHFLRALPFSITANGVDRWKITSAAKELTLRFASEHLTITSLAYQSGDPKADALAWPENHNPAAYEQLEAATFPWSLPVDLPLEEVRLFLDRARMSRLRLMELMLPVDRRQDGGGALNIGPAARTTREDTALEFSARNRNAVTVDAHLGDTLTTKVSVTKGTLTLTARAYPGVTIRDVSPSSLTISGTAVAINGALDRMVFLPEADYYGTATLTTETSGDAGSGMSTLDLKITPVADIADDWANTKANQPVVIAVLDNDTFENPRRSITAVNGEAITAGGGAGVTVSHGVVTLDAAGQLVFTPTKDFSGHASFTYTVSSNGMTETATVRVSVNRDDTSSYACEVLGLSHAGARAIGTQQSEPEVYAAWGVRSDTPIAVKDPAAPSGYRRVSVPPLDQLKNVSILLQQSRLRFEELRAVLATQFVSGGTAALRIEPVTTCKPTEMQLPGLTIEHVDRVHRFTRLWRRLGWTVRELDLTIDAFGGTLGPDTLLSLARVQRLQQRLRLPLDLLVGGLHHLETEPSIDHLAGGAPEQPSLYAAIFQRDEARAVSDFSAFTLLSNHSQLEKTPIRGITEHASFIGACLELKGSDVQRWVSGPDGLGIPGELNLTNLSQLSLAAGVCRALGINLETLAHHLQLQGTAASPFGSALSAHQRAGAMLDVLQRLHSVEQSGVEVESLRYLLQHYDAQGSASVLGDKQVEQLAGAAREAVRSIPDAAELPQERTAEEVKETARLLRRAREDAVVSALATALEAARDLVDDLLRTRLFRPSTTGIREPAVAAFLDPSFVDSDVPPSPVVAILMRLHKALIVCDGLRLSSADLRLLRASSTDANGFSALDFDTLPATAAAAPAAFADFEQLLAVARLNRLATNAGDLWQQYAAINFDAADAARAAHLVLATGLGLDAHTVEEAADQLQVTNTRLREPLAVARLVDLLLALKDLGATLEQASALTAASPDDAAALGARELLRSKYGVSQWHDLIKPIADTLRERQRNALVDYLVARDQERDAAILRTELSSADLQRGADDLYERYLIDVQTGSCLKTTRLLQATAAAQLFVQRLLLNLEKGLSLTIDQRERWEWIRNYRVWEANRKVFLFPENWLLPELRDDKTDTFRQMEGALTESEPSPESTRAALLGYLEELGDLAHISVIAMYQEVNTLYVVGRTPNQPYCYFWRSCDEFGSAEMSWSGWEALDLDNANDFIMPFVFEGDLHLAWPIFHKTRDEADQNALWWQVQIAWTRRSQKGWIKRKLSIGQLDSKVPRLPNKEAPASFAFRLSKFGTPTTHETVKIACYGAIETKLKLTTSLEIPSALKEDAAAVSTGPDNTDRWNVSAFVSGVLYEFGIPNEAEPQTFRNALKGVKVTLTYDQRWHVGGLDLEGDIHRLESSVETDDFGAFKFNIPATSSRSDNPREGVLNYSTIHVTFELGEPETLHQTLGDKTSAFKVWTWKFSHGIKNDAIKLDFDSPREVNYKEAGTFIVESGKDMRHDRATSLKLLPGPVPAYPVGQAMTADLKVEGNRFAEIRSGEAGTQSVIQSVISDVQNAIPNVIFGPTEGELSPPPPALHAPMFVTRSVQSPMPSGEKSRGVALYLQDRDRGSYLQKDPEFGTWQRWPDGQPYVSTYRMAASPSVWSLFKPELEAKLHFDPSGNTFARHIPYANYNWEVFLHAPLAIADYLVSQQRFEDARRWLHTIFDPTTDATIGTSQAPQFWRFLEFAKNGRPDSIAQMLTWLADPKTTDPTTDPNGQSFEATFAGRIKQWEQNPFMPHLIARLRPSAYQWHTFFAYLDVLIGWGDQLFRRDTRESVNEATLLYVLAAKLLGPRPRIIPAPTPPPPQTYRSLPKSQSGDLDGFGNAWLTYSELPGVRKLRGGTAQHATSTQAHMMAGAAYGTAVAVVTSPPKQPLHMLFSLSALAFCIPQNEKVTEFYDRVEDRLFNVRNCRSIEGVFRELPLYEPPIDPLLLIRARAAGLDLNTIMESLYAPLPNYRFNFTLQKALELCGELKSLGGALLSALEKKDAEALTQLRSSHEIAMLQLVRGTRQQQIAEADANIGALQQSEATILERFGQYQKLLGKPGITKGQDGLPVVEQSSSLTVSTNPVGGVSGLGLSQMEVAQLALTAVAHVHTQAASSGHILAGVVSLLPNIWAGGVVAGQTFGGINLGNAATAIAKSIEMVAADATYVANQMGTFAGYERRQDEWVHLSKLALAEMKQIQRQILAAQIRKSIAEHELNNHEKQIENARSIDDFMRSKFTNYQLFGWMSSQIAHVYFRTYQLALDQGRRAERAYQHEVGLESKTTPFVQAGHWDSLKRGLLVGERLHHDLKRMEGAYLERNVREFEITKHVSLLQLDPGALVTLRQTATCDFNLPEVLFDLDYPGHFMRRIKMVSLSIPCVAGPYASVSATLKLTTSEVRARSTGAYPHAPGDLRFVTGAATITAVVTSGAQQDSGMFEPNLRDERYLPFEGAGAISTWRLELPSAFRSFDYDSIADVVMHVRYTARHSDALKAAAEAPEGMLATIKTLGLTATKAGMTRLFSLRQEFPTEWNQLVGTAPSATGTQSQVFALTKNRFPFLFAGKAIKISSFDVYALPKSGVKIATLSPLTLTPPTNVATTWGQTTEIGRLRGKPLTLASPVLVKDQAAKWKLEILQTDVAQFKQDVDDILLMCHYNISDAVM